jgi:hypothetical protein
MTKNGNETIRLRVVPLVKDADKTIYAIARDGGLTVQTLYNWRDEGRDYVSLYKFLKGLGWTDERIAATRMGDIFKMPGDEPVKVT